jgi:aryl-alcohol dehydrogenase-like predicted oxidoreductase/NAD-dependent dihydropyrimidine dehydrogenase PreA subunit
MRNNLSLNNLGISDIEVSSICFGTLTVSPLQRAFSVNEAANLFCYAIDRGINFFDAAALYDTYAPLKEVLKYKKDTVIATKDYCYDEKTAQESLDAALKSIGSDYVDIFLLHEQESMHTIRGHWGAVEYLIKRKQKGDIRAIGLSTHFIAAVRDSLKYPEIEIIHPIYNIRGLGIVDGPKNEMRAEIEKAADHGKGIYLMKALGGGHLISNVENAFKEAMAVKGINSIAVGMKTREEIDYNVALFSGNEPKCGLKEKLDTAERRLHIHDWCIGCGACVDVCDKGALSIVEGKAVVDSNKCVLCGYCAPKCKEFCIKVI